MSKVLFFFTSCYPYGTGETFIENEIEYLSKAFDNIIIISNDTTSEQTRKVPYNIKLIRNSFQLTPKQKLFSYFQLFKKEAVKELLQPPYLSLKKINYLCQSLFKSNLIANEIDRLIKQSGFNTANVYLYSYWWLDQAIGIARFKERNKECKAFTRAHGYDLYHYRSTINYLPLKPYSATILDRVFTISNDGQNYLSNRYNISNTEISRLGTIQNLPIEQINANKNHFTIVSCAHIYPNKNILKIAKAIENIKTTSINWIHFGHYIEGYSENYYKELLEVISRIEKKHNIEVCLKGSVTNKEIIHYYSTHYIDLFVNASNYEGVPVSIMEAISFYIPILASDVGGTNEIVNNQNGLLFKNSIDYIELGILIEKMLSLPTKNIEEMRLSANKTWNERYNAEKNYIEFIGAINKL